MKRMARVDVWLPCIDKDIENIVKSCGPCRCEVTASDLEHVSRPRLRKPWEWLHLDYAGLFLDKMCLICVDKKLFLVHEKF